MAEAFAPGDGDHDTTRHDDLPASPPSEVRLIPEDLRGDVGQIKSPSTVAVDTLAGRRLDATEPARRWWNDVFASLPLIARVVSTSAGAEAAAK